MLWLLLLAVPAGLLIGFVRMADRPSSSSWPLEVDLT